MKSNMNSKYARASQEIAVGRPKIGSRFQTDSAGWRRQNSSFSVDSDSVEAREENTSSPKRRSSKIREMTMMFEQASSAREEAPKQRVVCGSPIAERKRQLQQLLVNKDDIEETSQFSVGSGGFSRISSYSYTSTIWQQRNNSHNAVPVAPTQNVQASNVADKKKLFESTTTKVERTPDVSSAEITATFAMTKTDDSDLSPLQYNGSLISEDTVAREERELRETYMSENIPVVSGKQEEANVFFEAEDVPVIPTEEGIKRLAEDVDGSETDIFRLPEVPGSPHESMLSPGNSFAEALQDIVRSFESDVRRAELESKSMFSEAQTKENRALFVKGGQVEDNSAISLFTSFDSEPIVQASASRGSTLFGDIAGKTNDGSASAMSIGNSVPIKTVEQVDSQSQSLPNASVFSTVEQEEQKTETLLEEMEAEEKIDSKGKFESDDVAADGGSINANEEGPSDEEKLVPEVLDSKTLSRSIDEFVTDATGFSYKEKADDPPQEMSIASELAKSFPYDKHPTRGMLEQLRQSLSTASSWRSFATSFEEASEASPQIVLPDEAAEDMIENDRKSVGEFVGTHLSANPLQSTAAEASTKPVRRKQRRRRRNSSAESIQSFLPQCMGIQCVASTGSNHPTTDNSIGSPSSMDPQTSINDQSNQDTRNLTDTMTNMANAASTVVLDVFIDAADKVVVMPLLQIFSCVDASESILCNSSANDMTNPRYRKPIRSRPHNDERKFKA